jgi:copper(I)-binding protein
MNMIMKNLALACSALAIGTASVAGQPTSAPAPAAAAVTNALGPKIKFATPMYDFGKARSGEPVKYTYIFTNTGDQLLILTNVAPQCGCTAAGDWTRQVEPGKTGNIPIQFNTASYNGPVFKQVTVTCNDKSQSTLFLQLKGTVYKPLEINPQLAVLNISPDAETGSMVVNITNNMDEALSLSAPESNNRAFAAELKTIQPGKGYQLTISAVPPLKPGSTQGQISLKTSWTNQPVLNVSVYANVQPPIVVIPSHITLPPAPLANSQTPSITIQNNSTNQLTLSEPAVNAQGVETQIKEMQPGRSFTALVTFPQGFEIPPGQQVELTVKSSNPKFPVVRVPITQFPRPAVSAAPPTPAAAATPDLPPLPTTLPETK